MKISFIAVVAGGLHVSEGFFTSYPIQERRRALVAPGIPGLNLLHVAQVSSLDEYDNALARIVDSAVCVKTNWQELKQMT